jgi:hypothetical protein
MTFPIQETDVAIPLEPPIFVKKDIGIDYQGTTGTWETPALGVGGYYFIKPNNERDLTEEARYVVHSIEDRNISERANKILTLFQRLLRSQGDISYLPSLSAVKVSDGSLLIEWIFDHFRVGFSFETDMDESSWYIVSDSTLGRISAGGYLSGMNIEQLLPWIIISVNRLLMS